MDVTAAASAPAANPAAGAGSTEWQPGRMRQCLKDYLAALERVHPNLGAERASLLNLIRRFERRDAAVDADLAPVERAPLLLGAGQGNTATRALVSAWSHLGLTTQHFQEYINPSARVKAELVYMQAAGTSGCPPNLNLSSSWFISTMFLQAGPSQYIGVSKESCAAKALEAQVKAHNASAAHWRMVEAHDFRFHYPLDAVADIPVPTFFLDILSALVSHREVAVVLTVRNASTWVEKRWKFAGSKGGLVTSLMRPAAPFTKMKSFTAGQNAALLEAYHAFVRCAIPPGRLLVIDPWRENRAEIGRRLVKFTEHWLPSRTLNKDARNKVLREGMPRCEKGWACGDNNAFHECWRGRNRVRMKWQKPYGYMGIRAELGC